MTPVRSGIYKHGLDPPANKLPIDAQQLLSAPLLVIKLIVSSSDMTLLVQLLNISSNELSNSTATISLTHIGGAKSAPNHDYRSQKSCKTTPNPNYRCRSLNSCLAHSHNGWPAYQNRKSGGDPINTIVRCHFVFLQYLIDRIGSSC